MVDNTMYSQPQQFKPLLFKNSLNPEMTMIEPDGNLGGGFWQAQKVAGLNRDESFPLISWFLLFLTNYLEIKCGELGPNK